MAGYGLQEYMEEEETIHSQRGCFGPEESWNMNIHKWPEEDAIILHIMDEDWIEAQDVEVQDLKINMPEPIQKLQQSCLVECMKTERGDTYFFTGPLKRWCLGI